MRRLIRALRYRWGLLASEWAKAHARIRFGKAIAIGAGVRLLPGVRIDIFDNGSIEIGANSSIGPWVILHASGGKLRIGTDSVIQAGSVIVAAESVAIGDGALIAEHVTIRDQDHAHGDRFKPIRLQGRVTGPIVIGEDVWLGAKVTVTRGVTIAAGTIVGANSVVTRSIERAGVYAGVPARLVGSPEDTRA